MGKKIIMGVMPEETKVAIIENGTLSDLIIERSEKHNIAGNIYKGKVKNVLLGMQAVFVDIGQERNAFLYTGDLNKAANITVGQEIVVQVVKEAIGDKGPRATTDISLAGRYVVLLPYGDYIGISKRIESQERERLKSVVEGLKPKGIGLILRTAAQGKSCVELGKDIEFLLNTWKAVTARIKLAAVPALLYRDVDLVIRIIRDYLDENTAEIIIDNKDSYSRIKELLSYSAQFQPQVKLFHSEEDIFSFFNLTAELNKVNDRRVWLNCGGYIVIDHTEALTVIDVNTGKFSGGVNLADTVFQTNCEAADEIARQLRLRDIGGIIIIDFIDMNNEEHKKTILEVLALKLKSDRTKTTVVGLTGLGLLEMTRKKIRPNLEGLLYNECSNCRGKGFVQSPETVAIAIKRSLRANKVKNTLGRALLIQANPKVIEFLTKNEEFLILQREMGKTVNVEPVAEMHPEAFAVFLDKS